MRIDTDTGPKGALAVPDFCAAVEAKLRAGASIWDCRAELRQLSHNKEFLLAAMHRELDELWAHDYRSDQGNPALLCIYNGSYSADHHYRVRCVFWEQSGHIHHRNKLFLYDDIPHDHNFELLTVGYAGPGYQTSIWQYDATGVTGYAGEKVPLSHPGRFTLAPGTVLWLQQNCDVHIQHSPAAASISLNLITWTTPQPRQYFFDIERQRISQVVPKLAQRREPLFQLAAMLGDDNTLDLLNELIAKKSLDPTLQRAAMAAATSIYRSKST